VPGPFFFAGGPAALTQQPLLVAISPPTGSYPVRLHRFQIWQAADEVLDEERRPFYRAGSLFL